MQFVTYCVARVRLPNGYIRRVFRAFPRKGSHAPGGTTLAFVMGSSVIPHPAEKQPPHLMRRRLSTLPACLVPLRLQIADFRFQIADCRLRDGDFVFVRSPNPQSAI